MLRVDQVHVIRHKVLIEGLSQRAVAREMDVSRNTVRKYLTVSEPKRVEQEPRRQPVLERVKSRLDELIDEWSLRTTRKQRLTGTRLHRQLVKEGHELSASVVRRYLREWRRRRAEVYVPLTYRAGDVAQVDFFEVTVVIKNLTQKAWMFLIRLMYSGRDFAWLYPRCDQTAFLDGHVRAFKYFGGVPARCVYDNLSAAVSKVTYPERQLTERLTALCSHYLFEASFARPGEGHDKGGVEGRGRGVRLQSLTPVPEGASLNAISEEMLSDIEQLAQSGKNSQGRTKQELFADELREMRALPEAPFNPRGAKVVHVGSSAKVRLMGAWYSVPSTWRSLEAMAYIGVDDIVLSCRGESVTRERQPLGGRDIRYRDYLPELAKKPQAVRQVAPELIRELGSPFGRLWQLLVETHGDKEAARILTKVLAAINEHGERPVAQAVEGALEAQRTDLLALAHLVARPMPVMVELPEKLSGFQIESACAAEYDELLVGEEL